MMLDRAQTEILERLADVLIPASDEMPSASEADFERWHQSVLTTRPDLAEPLQQILEAGIGKDPNEYVQHLRQNNRRLFRVLSAIVSGAYFMNPTVQKRIGYAGQTPQPPIASAENVEDSLLDPVIRRGPIFRVHTSNDCECPSSPCSQRPQSETPSE